MPTRRSRRSRPGQAFHVVDSAAPFLSKRFDDAHFDFRNQELAGQPEQRPRWKRGVDFVNSVLGEAVGRIYVAEYFPPAVQGQDGGPGRRLQTALDARIETLDWMSAADQGQGAGEAVQADGQDRLSGQVARLFGADFVAADDLYGDVARAARLRVELRTEPPERAGRQAGMGHDARRR